MKIYTLFKNNPPSLRKRGLGGVLLLISLLSFTLSAHADDKTIYWKQQIQLQDGRVMMVDRTSKQQGPLFPGHIIIEYEQTLSFTNPDTREKITWTIPTGLMPRMIDFDRKIPYIVFRAGSVTDYNTWNCPNPPHIIFRYINKQWQQITLEQLPDRFVTPNTLDVAPSEKTSVDSLVTVAEMQAFLKRSQFDERRIISRKKIHPIAEGCYAGTLYKLNRESEINVEYFKGRDVYKEGVLIRRYQGS